MYATEQPAPWRSADDVCTACGFTDDAHRVPCKGDARREGYYCTDCGMFALHATHATMWARRVDGRIEILGSVKP
jgi:hypothetical protein